MTPEPGPGNASLLQRLFGAINPMKGDFFNDALKGATGRGYSELSNAGREAYPDMAPGTAHHRLTSKMVTDALLDKLGWIPGVGETAAMAVPQLLGLGVEGSEAIGRMAGGVPGAGPIEHFQQPDTLRDLGANIAGSQEALEEWRRKNAAPTVIDPRTGAGF